MTRQELITKITQELKGLSTRFVSVDYENAVTNAEQDTGWLLPQSDGQKLRWLQKRTLRHLYAMLMSESAHKFKVEGINLQHRFDHYNRLVTEMDKEWEEAEPYVSAGFGAGGIKIDSGFAYDPHTGRDLSYSRSQRQSVIITPSVSSDGEQVEE